LRCKRSFHEKEGGRKKGKERRSGRQAFNVFSPFAYLLVQRAAASWRITQEGGRKRKEKALREELVCCHFLLHSIIGLSGRLGKRLAREKERGWVPHVGLRLFFLISLQRGKC